MTLALNILATLVALLMIAVSITHRSRLSPVYSDIFCLVVCVAFSWLIARTWGWL